MVAVGAAAIAPAAAQQVEQADRTAETTSVQAGQTVNITVDVSYDQATDFEIKESISPALDTEPTIVDADDASFTGTEVDQVAARYGQLGDDPRSSATLKYQVTIPSDAEGGDTFTISSEGDVDAGTTVLTVEDDGSDNASRTVPEGAEAGETVQVTVDVSYDQATDFEIKESISPALDTEPTIVDADDASFTGTEVDQVAARYGQLGDDPRSSATLVYEIQIPSNAEDGDTYTIASEGDVDAGTDVITVGASQPANFEVSNLNPATADVDPGEQVTVTADVENTGDEEDTKTVELTLDGSQEASTDETLAAGANTTVSFTITAPDQTGDYTHAVETEDDSESGTLTVSEPDVSGSVTFEDQATFSPSFTLDGAASDPAVVVSADANADSAIVVTKGDNLEIVTLDTYTAAELDGSAQVLDIADADYLGNGPGTYTAHVIPQSDLSQDYEPGDEVSDETANAVLDNADATVYQVFMNFADQTYSGETSELTVESTLSPADSDTLYSVVVHTTTSDGAPDTIVGASDLQAAGSDDSATVKLDSPIAPSEGGEYIAMIHLNDDDSAEAGDPVDNPGDLPVLKHAAQSSSDGFVAGGVTNSATVTVNEEAAAFSVSNLQADNADFENNDGSSAVAGVDTINVSATITNDDSVEDTQTVEFRAGGTTFASEEVTLDGGESTTVEFSLTAPDVAADTYTHGVYTDDDEATAQIEILPAYEVGNGPARDTMGDGLLNDVNGQQGFDIVDVGAFFDALDSLPDDVAPYFNFNGQGGTDIVDVGALFDMLP